VKALPSNINVASLTFCLMVLSNCDPRMMFTLTSSAG
jgi:hypothetical protein